MAFSLPREIADMLGVPFAHKLYRECTPLGQKGDGVLCFILTRIYSYTVQQHGRPQFETERSAKVCNRINEA